MGQSVVGRPIGPSYVPGTLRGQSSPFAVNPTAAVPPAATGTDLGGLNPVDTVAGNLGVPNARTMVNPAQDPRTKWLPRGAPIGSVFARPVRIPGTIGAKGQNTGFRTGRG